ncbi:acyl-CoA dehydrogenase family protein [Bradyrhizobium sp. LA7.1]|uniref:acyl-CoA dehydrogenase family protein n=1 Tax=Bradyrhizobium sp. LA7.1 TaxID=3156324 RepID=UPI003399D6EB
MKQILTERQRKLVGLAGELADEFGQRAEAHDLDGSFPFENYERMKQAGYLRVTVPEELGGLGATLPDLVLLQERLAQGCAATALAVNMHVSPVGQLASLWRINHDSKLERWLRDIADGKVINSTVSAEPGAPLLRHSNTKAVRVDGGYRITGKKIFGTGSSIMTHMSTLAQFDGPKGSEILMFRLSREEEGISILDTWHTLGMRATQSNDIVLDNVFVSDDSIFHRYPVGTLDGRMLQTVWGWAMPTFGATYLGVGAGALQRAKIDIKRFNKHDDPRVQALFGEMEILWESAHATLMVVAQEVWSGELFRQMSVQEGMSRVTMSKYVAANNAVAIVDKVMSVMGGGAYFLKSPYQRIYRDVRAALIQPWQNPDVVEIAGKTALGIEYAPEVPIPEEHIERLLRIGGRLAA